MPSHEESIFEVRENPVIDVFKYCNQYANSGICLKYGEFYAASFKKNLVLSHF